MAHLKQEDWDQPFSYVPQEIVDQVNALLCHMPISAGKESFK
jgi:hypothetical protein